MRNVRNPYPAQSGINKKQKCIEEWSAQKKRLRKECNRSFAHSFALPTIGSQHSRTHPRKSGDIQHALIHSNVEPCKNEIDLSNFDQKHSGLKKKGQKIFTDSF